jgi:tetratricopeptide (TPR) repeat protein
MDEAGTSGRIAILKAMAEIHEEKTREYGKALAAYREIEKARRPPKGYRADAILSVLRATCWHLSTRDRPGLVDKIQWCEREDRYDAVGFDSGLHREEPDYMAHRDRRVLDDTEKAFLNRDTGRRFDILRLLLKLKRADEAAALEKKLLSVFPKELKGRTRPEPVRRVLLERAARAHSDAGDYEGAMRLYARAHAVDTGLARSTISIALRRDSALREAADRYLRTRMWLARKAGLVKEYYRAFEKWKALSEERYRRERGQGLSGDGVLTGMVSRLVDVPEAFLRRESLGEAERLLARVEDRDARETRLLAAAVHMHRGRFKEAAALCDRVVGELEEAGKRKRLEERFLGNARDLLKYREEEDPLEDLEAGDLLLMARVYGAVGRKDVSKRLLGCAGKADEEKEHFRWEGIDPR